jgi:hypothetical protein
LFNKRSLFLRHNLLKLKYNFPIGELGASVKRGESMDL